MHHITATQLAEKIQQEENTSFLLLDVRQPWEFDTCHIPGSRSLPMDQIPTQLHTLDPQIPVICICHHGMRSRQVAHYLEDQGFEHITNLTGGVHAWSQEVDPNMPTY
jgi:rhodanese-related sulfurtransferase